MIDPTDEERRWFLRNLAHGLIEYLGVAHPPVWIESLLKHPPPVYEDAFGILPDRSGTFAPLYERRVYRKGSITRPLDLPIDERCFCLARELLIILGSSSHGHRLGLPEFLLQHLETAQDYFERVLLAPDSLVSAYR
ncbi:MAG: hypothetical protein BMS9Abin28_1480 [Anaerolineae bacterium]|nr:MAG: hypothetical protein BMS9Abin28_1480 [Anaerolineae bacterium]